MIVICDLLLPRAPSVTVPAVREEIQAVEPSFLLDFTRVPYYFYLIVISRNINYFIYYV